MKPVETARVFLALWPDAGAAGELHGFAGEQSRLLGGRAMRLETLHLTLAFLGEVTPQDRGNIEVVARSIKAEPFECRLDCCGIWPKKQLLWAGCKKMDKRLSNFVADLTSKLVEAGFRLERRPFNPHVTLVRNVRSVPAVLPELPVVQWFCSSFVLMQSVLSPQGASYKQLASWPLAR